MKMPTSPYSSLGPVLASALLLGACDPSDPYPDLGVDPALDDASPFRGGGWVIDPESMRPYCGTADLEHRDDDSGTLVVVTHGDLDGPIAELAPTDADGDFCVVLHPEQTYGVQFLPGDGRFLDVAGIWTTPSDAAPMPAATLRIGDLDGNDRIDELDGSILLGAIDCEAPAAPAIFEDLDGDGVVCDGDVDIVDENAGSEGPLAWIFTVEPVGGGGLVLGL